MGKLLRPIACLDFRSSRNKVAARTCRYLIATLKKDLLREQPGQVKKNYEVLYAKETIHRDCFPQKSHETRICWQWLSYEVG